MTGNARDYLGTRLDHGNFFFSLFFAIIMGSDVWDGKPYAFDGGLRSHLGRNLFYFIFFIIEEL